MSKQATAQVLHSGALTHKNRRAGYVEDWLQTPGVNADLASGTEATRVPRNRNFEVLGNNGTSALCTFADGGGITITTDTGGTDAMIILPHLDTKQTAWAATKWNTSDQVAMSGLFKFGASVADLTFYYGLKLTNTPAVATDDDQAFFRYQDTLNGGKLQAIVSVGGTDYTADTGIEVTASKSMLLEIVVDSERKPHFFVDGNEVHVGPAMTANIDLIPYFGILNGTTAAKAVTCRPGYAISKEFND